ncbi:hypothetical protein BGX31_003964 [Mortierella sp. GBA43]|nr:hypothetical protein BGX31_003964 [Mortierella sp. GBA43]
MADEYELGLRGTTDSVLDLGALGQIEVQGIKLDVRTKLAGLKGLKDVQLLSVIGFEIPQGFTKVTSLVKINNPSKLTLKLGNLVLKGGLDTTEAGYAGNGYMTNMVLVPGDNELMTALWLVTDGTRPAATKISTDLLYGNDVKLTLYGFDGSSPNVPLAKGLGSLVTSVVLPGFLPPAFSAQPYDAAWAIKVTPETLTTGLVDVTIKLNAPYFKTDVTYHEFTDFNEQFPELPPTVAIFNNQAKGGSLPLYTNFNPIISLGGDPTLINPDWSSTYLFPDTGLITIKTGPDFEILRNYNQANVGKQPLVETPPALTTTLLTTPTPTATTTESAVPTPTTTEATTSAQPTETSVPTTTAPVEPTPTTTQAETQPPVTTTTEPVVVPTPTEVTPTTV